MPHDTFQIVWLVGFIVGSVIRKVYTKRRKPEDVERRRQTVPDTMLIALASLGLVVIPLLYLVTSWLDFADWHLPTWASQAAGWAGAAVFLAALWLLWRSHVDLGRNWSALVEIRQEHTLVTGGVYRRIRHPMYAAHWLWAVAQVLLLQNWIAGPALLVFFLPLYWLRVPREEQLLLDQFGDEYRAYMSHTGRIIPRLWT
jgi:protein-S-isoprenylcysteine O-methyltransferase Ste14